MENCLTKEIKRKISLKENNEVDFVVFVRSVLCALLTQITYSKFHIQFPKPL